MSSDAANVNHFGGLKDYRGSEGREVLVPYSGMMYYYMVEIYIYDFFLMYTRYRLIFFKLFFKNMKSIK
jgi:hypothetical protein